MAGTAGMFTFGSPTATPSIRPFVSCSAAAMAAPPPLETAEAMTRILSLPMDACRTPSDPTVPNLSLIAQMANSMAWSVFSPQLASGFCFEWACL
ncbi:hypothetical protein D3C72_2049540 [compost metagenome]